MTIANTICISQKKAICDNVDLIAIVFQENSEISQGFEFQSRTSKSGVCLDKNSMFVDRREKWVGIRNLDFLLFCELHKWMAPYKIFFCYWIWLFCFSLSLHSLRLHTVFDFYFFSCEAKELTAILKKDKGEKFWK